MPHFAVGGDKCDKCVGNCCEEIACIKKFKNCYPTCDLGDYLNSILGIVAGLLDEICIDNVPLLSITPKDSACVILIKNIINGLFDALTKLLIEIKDLLKKYENCQCAIIKALLGFVLQVLKCLLPNLLKIRVSTIHM